MGDSLKHGAMYNHDSDNIAMYKERVINEGRHGSGSSKDYSRPYQAMYMRRIDGMTYKAIADVLGVTKERARQLSAKGEAILNRLLVLDRKERVKPR